MEREKSTHATLINEHLVRESRLQATFWSEGTEHYTIHTLQGSHRAAHTQEIWTNLHNLGHGGQGSVDLQIKQTNRSGRPQYRAVKTVRLPEGEITSNRDIRLRELEAIVKFSQLRYGELFVKTFGWYTGHRKLFIAMEYCELGDLHSYLSDAKKCPENRLPEDQTQEITSQLLDALSMMHEEYFAHRDLKPANILITSHHPDPWRVKLGDFGISRQHEGHAPTTTNIRGTPRFMSPELLGFSTDNSRSVDLYASDMWCLGETIFRILAGRGTFANHADLSRFYFGHIEFPSKTLQDLGVSEHGIAFIRSLIVCDPTKRLTTETAASHPWMALGPLDPSHDRFAPTWLLDDLSQAVENIQSPSGDINTQASASWPTLQTQTGTNGPLPPQDTVIETQPSGSWTEALQTENWIPGETSQLAMQVTPGEIPFHSTAGADHAVVVTSGRAGDSGTTEVRHSQTSPNASEISGPSYHSSVNSNTALLKSKPLLSAFPKMIEENNMVPMRSRRHIKDPYAIEFSDEDEDLAYDLITPNPPPKKEESLAEFLRKYESSPMPVPSPPPQKLSKKKARKGLGPDTSLIYRHFDNEAPNSGGSKSRISRMFKKLA